MAPSILNERKERANVNIKLQHVSESVKSIIQVQARRVLNITTDCHLDVVTLLHSHSPVHKFSQQLVEASGRHINESRFRRGSFNAMNRESYDRKKFIQNVVCELL